MAAIVVTPPRIATTTPSASPVEPASASTAMPSTPRTPGAAAPALSEIDAGNDIPTVVTPLQPGSMVTLPFEPSGALPGVAVSLDSVSSNDIDGTSGRSARFDVVAGIPIQDTGTRKTIKRVIVIAALGATFYTVHFIRNLMSGRFDDESADTGSTRSLWTAMSGLLIELSVPACGYYGAIHANRQLTCCFCSCNLFVTVLSLVTFTRLIRAVHLDGDCDNESNPQQKNDCEVLLWGHAEKYVMITSMVIGVCLGTAAFWFGSNLYKHLAHDLRANTGSTGPPLIGEVIHLESEPVPVPISPTPITVTTPVAYITDGQGRRTEMITPPVSPRTPSATNTQPA